MSIKQLINLLQGATLFKMCQLRFRGNLEGTIVKEQTLESTNLQFREEEPAPDCGEDIDAPEDPADFGVECGEDVRCDEGDKESGKDIY